MILIKLERFLLFWKHFVSFDTNRRMKPHATKSKTCKAKGSMRITQNTEHITVKYMF